MRAVPSHRNLQRIVKFIEPGVALHLNTSPDGEFGAPGRYFQLVNGWLGGNLKQRHALLEDGVLALQTLPIASAFP